MIHRRGVARLAGVFDRHPSGGVCQRRLQGQLGSLEVLGVSKLVVKVDCLPFCQRSSLPWLTRDGGAGQVMSGWGLLLASLLLVLFAWINLAGVGVLARWIEGLTSGNWWCPSPCRSP